MMCEYNLEARMSIDDWMGSDEADNYRLMQRIKRNRAITHRRMEEEQYLEECEDDTV